MQLLHIIITASPMNTSKFLDAALIWFFSLVTLVMLWHGIDMIPRSSSPTSSDTGVSDSSSS